MMKPAEAYSILTQLLATVNVPLKDHDIVFQAINEVRKVVDDAQAALDKPKDTPKDTPKEEAPKV